MTVKFEEDFYNRTNKKTINPVNVGERDLAKMYCISLSLLRKKRQEKEFGMDICFTVKGSCKILYNVAKFDEWFQKNKWMAIKDYNAEIKRTVERINIERQEIGLPKI